MPAKLPPELIEPSKRRLRELQIGEQGAVTFAAMKVDADGFCYLDPDANLLARTFGWRSAWLAMKPAIT